MKRVSIPGTAYGDCSPAGDWVCSTVGRPAVLTSWQGEIPVPAEMLSNRLHGRKIAGKTQSPGTVSVFDGQWLDTGIDSPGVQGHSWDDAGTLYILKAGPDQESMGLQFYDPSITSPNASFDVFHTTPGFVTGSAAYSPTTALAQELGVSRLFLWTKFGDVAVGQGDSGGTAIQYHGAHYLLESGDSRFVQFHRDGDQLAIAITRFGQGDTVFHWLMVYDIPRLPLYGADPIEPEPGPEPEPEPDMDFPAAEWSIVQQMHARFSGNFPPTEDGARRWTEMTIQQLVHSFPSGGWCWKKSGQGNPPSKDCMARQTGGRFEGWDTLVSASTQGPRVLSPDPAYHDLAGQVPIAVPPVNHLGGVVEPPPTNDGKHPYERDDDDRDECNFIMPDGSQCDQPKAAEIHQVTDPIDPPDPPDPIDPPPTSGVTNAEIMAQLKRLSAHLGLR